MSDKQIFVNLPIKDVARSRAFWTALGFSINEQFSDENAFCLVLDPDHIYAMLITHPMFQTFTPRPIADGSTSQVLLSIDVGSREQVDFIINTAVAHGASKYMQPEDMGWMYYDRFIDLDGHQWEIMCADPALIPQA